jgi:hypothetical protein
VAERGRVGRTPASSVACAFFVPVSSWRRRLVGTTSATAMEVRGASATRRKMDENVASTNEIVTAIVYLHCISVYMLPVTLLSREQQHKLQIISDIADDISERSDISAQ